MSKLADDRKKADAERLRMDADRTRLDTAVKGLQADHATWSADCKRVNDQRRGELDLLDRERKEAADEVTQRNARLAAIQSDVDAAAEELRARRAELATVEEGSGSECPDEETSATEERSELVSARVPVAAGPAPLPPPPPLGSDRAFEWTSSGNRNKPTA